MFESTKDKYRVGDFVKYEYLKGDFSNAKILELNEKTVKIEIGLPCSRKNDVYIDTEEVTYDKILPFNVYMKLYEEQDKK